MDGAMSDITVEAGRILEFVRSNPGVAKNAIRRELNMSQTTSDTAIETLVNWGHLRLERKPAKSKNGTPRYRLYVQDGGMHVTVAESARVTGADLDYVPVDPMEEKPQAAYALWHYLRAQARKAQLSEERNGRAGWLWEGSLTGAATELWQGTDSSVLKTINTRLKTWLQVPGNIHCEQRPTGGSPALWWVAEEFIWSQARQGPSRGKRSKKAELEPVEAAVPEVVEPVPVEVVSPPEVEQNMPVSEAHRADEVAQNGTGAVDRDREFCDLERAYGVLEHGYRKLEKDLQAREREVSRLKRESEQMRLLISTLQEDQREMQKQLSAAQNSVGDVEQDPRVRHLLMAVSQAAEVADLIRGPRRSYE